MKTLQNLIYNPNFKYIEDNKKDITFINLDEFSFESRVNKYYSKECVNCIKFIVKNVDEQYNKDPNIDKSNKIYLTVKLSSNNTDPIEPTKIITIDDSRLNIEYENNNAVVTYTDSIFTNKSVSPSGLITDNNHHATFDVYSDNSGNTRTHNSFKLYYDRYNVLTWNLDYDKSYASTYLRKLKGTTNAWDDIPTDIEVYVNGIKTSPVRILNKNDNVTAFEKDLYLSDGKNEITIIGRKCTDDINEPILPAQYQEIQWINGAENNSFIDTEVFPTKDIKIIVRASYNASGNALKSVLGCENRAGSGIQPADEGICIRYRNTNTLESYINRRQSITTTISFAPGQISTIELSKDHFIIDKQDYTASNWPGVINSFTAPYSIHLCGINRHGDHQGGSYYHCIGICEIWLNDEYIRHFKPCYDKATGDVGMYDLVTNKFYENKGSKSFLAGPNRLIYTSEIYIDAMSSYPEKVDLLNNFIGTDDNDVSLNIGSAKLKYENSNAGLDKNVLIDTSIPTHYFELTGRKSNLYRISFDNIPLIKSDIIQRPLGITYDYVEKVYDGTNDITSELRKLKLDDGYYFTDVHKEYDDYGGTGLVRGTSERKTNQTVLYSQGEYIKGIVDLCNDDEWNTYAKLISKLKELKLITDDNREYIINLISEFKIILDKKELTELFNYEIKKSCYDENNPDDILRFIMETEYKKYLDQIYIPELGFYNSIVRLNLNTQYMFYNGFIMNLDGIQLYAIPTIDDSGRETSATLVSEPIEYSEVTNSKFNELKDGIVFDKGLFYSKFKIVNLETGIEEYIYKTIDTTNFNPIIKEFANEIDAKDWLIAYKHAIKTITLVRNTDDSTTIIFKFIKDISEYKIQSNLMIKYNYKSLVTDKSEFTLNSKVNSNQVKHLTLQDNSITNLNLDDTTDGQIEYNYTVELFNKIRFRFKNSDVGKIQTTFSNAFFNSKNVTDTVERIAIQDISLIGDILGDVSKNYQIANYTASGRIKPRVINPNILCLDKVYDGNNQVPCEIDESKFYHGFENSVDNDDIYLNVEYIGDPLVNEHHFKNIGTTSFVFTSIDVGNNIPTHLEKIKLEGIDSKNYELGVITSNYHASIFPREIGVIIDKIRLYRTSLTYEVDYTIVNDIKKDNITIRYNTNDDLDIAVFGGIDADGQSIHENINIDIKNLFFKYSFKTNYKFEDVETELNLVSEKTQTAYYKDEVRLAEPNTRRLDVQYENNVAFPGEIKQSKLNALPMYFESENKEYKLYDGCTVMVKNINLNPLNLKAKNYKLLNSTCETTIEII